MAFASLYSESIDLIVEDLVDSSLPGLSTDIGVVLIAAFGIAVGFVAYKLIKRALNKA